MQEVFNYRRCYMSKKYKKYQIPIPFSTVDLEIKYLPMQISEDASIFMLYSQKKYYINPGAKHHIPTGVRLMIPDVVETTEGEEGTSRYSKMTLQATIHTSNYLAESKGIVVLTPTILSPTYKSEISLFCINLTKDVQVINPGDELAILAFNMVPRIQLIFTPNIIPKGKPYVL